jgi:serine/threonine-protein kinase
MGDPAVETRRQFGEYEVESVLGKGAMGLVYLARDRRIGRRVALKTVQINQQFEDDSEATEFYRRLQREAEVCGAMQHPNIVTLYEPGYENNVISYLATEYVDGESLRERLKRSKPLPVDDALRIGEDILRGLAYAHAKGVVHRDIKPANILLSANGQAKIADFGIARPVDSTLTAVGSMLGTPNYMSPEQVKCAAVTAKSDVFSTGVVLYEMLTGVKPFSAPEISSILRNVVERVPPLAHEVNAEIPEPLSHFVSHLFAKTPDDRFENAAEALAELMRIRGQTPPVSNPRPVATEAPPDAAISTVAAGSSSRPLDGTTDQLFDDVTPAITGKSRHTIPPSIFFSIVGGLAAALLASVAIIHGQTDARPTGVITPQQLMEFSTKKYALAHASGLLRSGHYDDSVKAYDDFLKRYPKSITGRQGRAEAVKAADAHRPKSTVTTRASKSKPKSSEPEKRRSILDRLFRRNRK